MSQLPITRRERALSWFAIAYMLMLAGVLGVLRVWGDVAMPLTLLIYGPRILLVLPALAIAALGCLYRLTWTAKLALLLTLPIVLIGIMDFRIPWPQTNVPEPDARVLRLLTFNTLQSADNGVEITELLSQEEPDVIALQECRHKVISFPAGHQAYRYGELAFSTSLPVIRTPEKQYSFTGRIRYMSFFKLPLSGSDVQALHGGASGEIPDSLRDVNCVHRVTGQAQSLRAAKLEFTEESPNFGGATIDLRLTLPAQQTNSRQFVLELGDYWHGTNIYVEKDEVVVGAWRGQQAGWYRQRVSHTRDIHLTLVYHTASLDVYANGRFESSVAIPSLEKIPQQHEHFAFGSFHGTTRCQGYKAIFPNRAITFLLDVDGREVGVACVHNPTPRHAFLDITRFESHYREFAIQSRAIADDVQQSLPEDTPQIIMGDLNLPIESHLYHELWASKYTNAFSAAGFGYGRTKRTSLFGMTYGTRIDQVLQARVGRFREVRPGRRDESDHSYVVSSLVTSD